LKAENGPQLAASKATSLNFAFESSGVILRRNRIRQKDYGAQASPMED
jgi:hypothetical protein